MTDVQAERVCRACGEHGLKLIVSLGRTPLANSLLTVDQLNQPEPTYALELALCTLCSLVQITETVAPEKLFRDYAYLSSFSDTMLRHAEESARTFTVARNLGPDSLVVEVASNDGYLLQFYKRTGVPVLGIEPARNIAQIAESQRKIPTICDFFGETLARELVMQGKRADIIHANNVLAHVPDLEGMIRGFAALLKPEGILVVEVPYVKDMIDQCEFDTIYHEHLSYFSLTALENLFRRHGLRIDDVKRLSIHGGSLRIVAGLQKTEDDAADVDVEGAGAVKALLQEEAGWGVKSLSFYQGFAGNIEHLKRDLLAVLNRVKSAGATVAAYGASAKGCTLLNYCGIGGEMLEFVVDRSPVKQGRYTPGTHLKINAPETLLNEMPDYVLLLTWNFEAEILEQQREYRERGGRFISPIPEVRII